MFVIISVTCVCTLSLDVYSKKKKKKIILTVRMGRRESRFETKYDL